MSVTEGQLLWEPSTENVNNANVTQYIHWLKEKQLAEVADYNELWQWSVNNTEAFWASLWNYFNILSDTPYEKVTDSLEMNPGNRWFIGSRVNFAEHILRNEKAGEAALFSLSETRALEETSWETLASQVRILATKMRAMKVQPGDAVCCLMPNIPETVIAMLATISIGAVWSNAAPEFGNQTILDRFTQIKPKWLFVADGYQFGGKPFDRRQEIKAIVAALSGSLEQVIYLPYLNPDNHDTHVEAILWSEMVTGEDPGREQFQFQRVDHNHPLWILFSSGTTGLPKAIVHSHQGALIEMMKMMTFHMNLTEKDISFFYTTTGWVMFTLQVGMMLTGARGVFYDGNPTYPNVDVLWKMAADTRATVFGASPTYIQVMEQKGIKPNEIYDLSAINAILCSGSPATPETFVWFYENVKKDLWLTSQSGGTELVSGFVGASPTLPVYAGEIQCRMLGMNVESWDEEGKAIIDDVGELICKTSFPSMPIYFLGDDKNKRYNESYFEDYPGIWRHGDFIKINQRGGVYIYGRSDSTLNRYGVRIGTSELYRVVDKLPNVVDSLVLSLELPGGEFYMPMFLQLVEGVVLTNEIINQVKSQLREHCSPRHIPDTFYAIPAVPYTLTGKKLEVPLRKLLMGWPLEKAASRDSLRNPEALDFFLDYVANTQDYAVPGK